MNGNETDFLVKLALAFVTFCFSVTGGLFLYFTKRLVAQWDALVKQVAESSKAIDAIETRLEHCRCADAATKHH